MIIDLKLPDMPGHDLLRAHGRGREPLVPAGDRLHRAATSRATRRAELLRYSRSIIIKGARSPERLLDEVTLFLHQVESQLSTERQTMLRDGAQPRHAPSRAAASCWWTTTCATSSR